MLVIVTMVYLFHCLDDSLCAKEEKFYHGEMGVLMCDLDQRITNNCSRVLENVNTLNKCVAECARDWSCIGASLGGGQVGEESSSGDNPSVVVAQGVGGGGASRITPTTPKMCYLHYQCQNFHTSESCSSSNSSASSKLNTSTSITQESHKFMSKNCAHGGTWNPVSSKCSCVDGWVGESCLEIPNRCEDLISNGYASGLHRTYLNLGGETDTTTDTDVVCFTMTSTYWSAVVLFENHGNIYFNRSWEEYRKGFFQDDKNFWIGLESWHALTRIGFNALTLNMFNVGFNAYRLYHDFHVNDESKNFSIALTGITLENGSDRAKNYPNNKMGDCLTHLQNVSFSVPVGSPHNSACASKAESGWWFPSDCKMTKCNMLGKLPDSWTAFTPPEQKFYNFELNPDYVDEYKSQASSLAYIENRN